MVEQAGYVTLTGPDELKVPYHVAARPAGTMRSTDASIWAERDGVSATVTLTGTPVSPASGYQPRVWALELQAISPAAVVTSTTSPPPIDDLRYVGVGTDLVPGGDLTEATIYFGISTYHPWSTASGEGRIEIDIDSNRDGRADYQLSNVTFGPTVVDPSADPDDIFVAALSSLTTTMPTVIGWLPLNGFTATISTVPYSSTIMVLPVRARDLGLRAGQTAISYTVRAYSPDRSDNASGDKIGALAFDPAAPGIRASGGLNGAPVFEDVPGTTIAVSGDQAAWTRGRPLGLLLLHYLNGSLSQAEAIGFNVGAYLPFVARTAG